MFTYWVAASAAGLAEPSDGPRLLVYLTATTAGGTDRIGAQCGLVDALDRLGHTPCVETVEAMFDSTVYSYLRERCAVTTSRLSPAFARERAIECLDDCESGTRLVGITHADLSIREVRERLGRIAEDPTEDDDNRQAARNRIFLDH